MQTISLPLAVAAFPLQHGVRELLENALDQALLIANIRGEVLFATRKTRNILEAMFPEQSDDVIPNEIRAWLAAGDTNKPLLVCGSKKGEIRVRRYPFSPSGHLSLMQ